MKKICFLTILFALSLGFVTSGLAKDSNSLESSFYFVQITDTHLEDNDNFERAEKIIEKINALPFKVEFVIHTGDIFSDNIGDESALKAAKELFAGLKAPIYYVAGNHDIKSEKTKNIYITNFGQLNYVKQSNGIVLIFIYTNHPKNDSDVFNADFFKWFEDSLKSARNKPVIVFQHIPAGKDFYTNMFYKPLPAKVEKKWHALINKYKVKAVIAGHFHRDELHWFGKVPLYVAGPVSKWLGRQASYRIYEYKDGKIDYSTQYLDAD